MELPRRPRLNGGVAGSPWYFVLLGTRVCPPRGRSKARPWGVQEGAGRSGACRARRARALAASSAGQGPPGGSPPGLDKAIAAKQKHAERVLDKPGVAGIGVGLNPAGKPVIRIYKEKTDVADLPTTLDGVAVEPVTTGVHRAARPRPPTATRDPSRSASRQGSPASRPARSAPASRTGRTSTRSRTTTSSPASTRRASATRSSQPGDVDGGSDPGDRIGTLAATRTIDFSGGTNTMDAAIALTSTANVGTATPADGYGLPEPDHGTGVRRAWRVQKYGRTTGLQLGIVAATNVVGRRLLLRASRDFCLQEARFVNQISISPGPFSAPGDSGSLIVTQGGNQPVGAPLRRRRRPHDRDPDRPRCCSGSASRSTARRPATGRPAPPPPSPRSPATRSVDALLDALRPSTAARPSRTTRSIAARARTRRRLADARRRRRATPTRALRTARPTTTRCPPLTRTARARSRTRRTATPTALVAPASRFRPSTASTAPTRTRSPTPGRWTNGDQRLGRDRPLHAPRTARLLEDDDLHRLAQQRPVRPRRRGLGAALDAARRRQPAPPVRAPPAAGHRGLRRLHAAHEPARGNRPGPPRARRQRRVVNLLTINQELAAGDVLLLRVKGSTLEAWRHDGSAWSRLGVVQDSTYAAAGYVGVGMRGTTGRARRLRRADARSAEPARRAHRLPATPATRRSSSTWIDPAFDGGSPITRLHACTAARARARAARTSPIATTPSTSYADTSSSTARPTTTRCRAQNANGDGAALERGVARRPRARCHRSSRFPPSTTSTAPTRTRSPTPAAGRTASAARRRDRPLHDRRTRSPARRRRPARPGATPPSTAPTSRSWARHLDAARDEQPAPPVRAPAAAGHRGLRRLHAAHEPARGNRPGLPRARRQRRRRQPADHQPGARRRRRLPPARQGHDASRPGATTARPGRGSGVVRLHLRGRRLRRRRHARHDRPRSTTSARGRSVRRRPTPSRRARREPERDARRARARSTSPGGRRPTTSRVTLYRIERCQGAGCSNFVRDRDDLGDDAIRTPASAPRPPTPTACAPRTPSPTSGAYSNTASATTLAPPDTEPPSAPGT